MNEKLFEIVDIRTTDNPFLRKRSNQICDITSHKKAMAVFCIKYIGNKKIGSSLFINDETFYEAIRNADEHIKKEILKILTPVKEKVSKAKEKVVKVVAKKEPIKDKIEKVAKAVVKEVKEVKEIKEVIAYVLTEDDNDLLEYDNTQIDTKNYATRYWNKLTKLADNLQIDYTKVKDKEYKELRKLFENVEVK